ncbi:molybdenum cofactor guanylyltransferase [Microbacterium sp.]|uniref:molybdenum cofactor guanylyltransferase n=1 Tax=Microbacterium sp. TaxID=51671 RepID=UPI003A8B8BAB
MTGAILLAGGRATRLGGCTKPLLEVAGRTLLRRAVDAVDGCRPITVVAPVLDDTLPVAWVREDPPYGGPAAAVVAALASWPADEAEPDWTVLLACDLPDAAAAVARLRRDVAFVPGDTDGVCLGDESSRPQWLTGMYRTRALRTGAGALPGAGAGASMRDLLTDLAIAVIPAPPHETADVDTWQDVEKARARAGGTESR